MTGERVAREAFEQWFAGLPTFRHTDGPARGQVAAALVVLDRLKEDYDERWVEEQGHDAVSYDVASRIVRHWLADPDRCPADGDGRLSSRLRSKAAHGTVSQRVHRRATSG